MSIFSVSHCAPPQYQDRNDPGCLVWRKDKSFPSTYHPIEMDARTEATRLAGLNPGAKFYVMKSVGSYQTASVPVSFIPTR